MQAVEVCLGVYDDHLAFDTPLHFTDIPTALFFPFSLFTPQLVSFSPSRSVTSTSKFSHSLSHNCIMFTFSKVYNVNFQSPQSPFPFLFLPLSSLCMRALFLSPSFSCCQKKTAPWQRLGVKPELSDKARETGGVSRVSNKQCFLALRHAELKLSAISIH